jgi:trimeric autotransporter adhesin
MNCMRCFRLALFCSIVIAAMFSTACDDPAAWGSWVTDGPVKSIATSGKKVYLGGNFSCLWPNTGGGALLDTTTGMIVGKKKVLYINNTVRAVAPDGAGGFYIGGEFTKVGSATRNRIAHINADGTLAAWNPNCNGTVYALAVNKTTVYAAGSFSNIGGYARSGIAGLDVKTGAATAWNPDSTSMIYCLVLSGTTLYVGGEFNGDLSIGGVHRDYIAALNTTADGAVVPYVLDWDPDANNAVYCMALSGTTLFVGGGFGTVDGGTHTCLAALDTTATSAGNYAFDWDPDADGAVNGLAVSGTTLYAVGAFKNFGATARNYIAAFDFSTEIINITQWDPGADDLGYAVSCLGNVVYVAGRFTKVNGETRNGIAALDATAEPYSYYDTAWDPVGYSGNIGYCVCPTSKGVYFGGYIVSLNLINRNGLACVDTTTGLVTPWDPHPTGGSGDGINAIAATSDTVYVGGSFEWMNEGTNYSRNVAEISAETGQAVADAYNINGEVYALALSKTTLYAGGTFTYAGTSMRSNLAAINRKDRTVQSWAPNANDSVRALLLDGTTLYVGGLFNGTSIGVTPVVRNCLAAVDTTTGEATAWAPEPNNYVYAMTLVKDTLYVGGEFTQIDGRALGYVGALNIKTNTHGAMTKDWNPGANAAVRSLSYNNKLLYAGGDYNTINAQSVSYLSALNTTVSGANIVQLSWLPGPNNAVFAVKVIGDYVFAGGVFTSVLSGVVNPCNRLVAASIENAYPYGNGN